MPRPRKEHRSVDFKLKKEVCEMLDEYAEETGLTKTAAVERILSNYFIEWKRQQKKAKRGIL